MPEIQFPTSTAPGINPTESGGRLINAYVELAPAGSRSQFIWRAVPGLREATDVGEGDHRGALQLGSTVVAINGDEAYSLTYGAGIYSVNALTGDPIPGGGRVIMARNMKATPQIVVITDDGMSLIEGGIISDFSDADLPAPNSACFKDGYWFFSVGDGRCFASGINAETVASTDWNRAESSPDGLLRVVALSVGIAMFGENSTEIFSNTAEPTGFPFSRSAALPFGLFGRFATTGFEEGFTGDVMFVANDASVQLIKGFSLQRVSTPDLETLIAAITDRTTLEASCYVANGQPVYVLSCDDWTWEYSPASATAPAHWRERRSLTSTRWRSRFTVNAFDQWLSFDAEGTAVLRIDPTFRREGTDQLVWEMRSTQAHRFPGRAVIHRASFDFVTGVGIDTGIDPIETDPTVEISWSDDGGRTFGTPLFRSLGTQGEVVPVEVTRCGLTKRFGRQWKLRIPDPVIIGLMGGAMEIEERAA
jgi:hypothetical protein